MTSEHARELPPLTAFVPHRPPMLLLDRMIDHRGDVAVCTKTFTDADPFVENGRVSALIALELFAQTAAAHFGWVGMQEGGTMGAGALLGARKIELFVGDLRVGEPLTIRVHQVMAMPPAAQFECTLLGADGTRYAEGVISVAIAG